MMPQITLEGEKMTAQLSVDSSKAELLQWLKVNFAECDVLQQRVQDGKLTAKQLFALAAAPRSTFKNTVCIFEQCGVDILMATSLLEIVRSLWEDSRPTPVAATKARKKPAARNAALEGQMPEFKENLAGDFKDWQRVNEKFEVVYSLVTRKAPVQNLSRQLSFRASYSESDINFQKTQPAPTVKPLQLHLAWALSNTTTVASAMSCDSLPAWEDRTTDADRSNSCMRFFIAKEAQDAANEKLTSLIQTGIQTGQPRRLLVAGKDPVNPRDSRSANDFVSMLSAVYRKNAKKPKVTLAKTCIHAIRYYCYHNIFLFSVIRSAILIIIIFITRCRPHQS